MDELLDAVIVRVESAIRGEPASLVLKGRNRQESVGLDRVESIVLAAGRKQPCAVLAKNFVQLVNNVPDTQVEHASMLSGCPQPSQPDKLTQSKVDHFFLGSGSR